MRPLVELLRTLVLCTVIMSGKFKVLHYFVFVSKNYSLHGQNVVAF